jgi:hypothetical protein
VGNFSQIEIDQLISCPREVSEAPRREMKAEGAHLRNSAKLIPKDGTEGEFTIFVRQNLDFPENFSIGLACSPQDGRETITLIRCNGKHGDFNENFDPDHPHSDFHIHRATEDAINDGRAPEKFATKTTEYASIEEALQVFVKMVNLDSKDAQKYFSAGTQLPLSFEQ